MEKKRSGDGKKGKKGSGKKGKEKKPETKPVEPVKNKLEKKMPKPKPKKDKAHAKVMAKAKAKGKEKGKKAKKSSKPSQFAKKIPLSGVARKLPIEEVDESVDIDWSDEGDSGSDIAMSEFERTQLEQRLKYLERENMNLQNELYYIKPDLDKKTELITNIQTEYDRLKQDFEKHKKQLNQRMKEKQRYASEKLITEILEVLDNFDRTNKLDLAIADKEDVLKGIRMIYKQLMEILGKEGLKPIKAARRPFDPRIHDAVATTHTDEHPNNTVLEELQKGYKLKDKVLRPSTVRVSQSDIIPEIPIKFTDKKKKHKKDKHKKEKHKKDKHKKKSKPQDTVKKIKKAKEAKKANKDFEVKEPKKLKKPKKHKKHGKKEGKEIMRIKKPKKIIK